MSFCSEIKLNFKTICIENRYDNCQSHGYFILKAINLNVVIFLELVKCKAEYRTIDCIIPLMVWWNFKYNHYATVLQISVLTTYL